MVDFPDAANQGFAPNNKNANRREAISGADLLRDGSTPARKLTDDSFVETLQREARSEGQPSAPAYHEEQYKADAEAGTPSDNQPVTVARGIHGHDYQFLDEREALDNPDADAHADPVQSVSGAPKPPFGEDYSLRSVTWSFSTVQQPQPCRIYGQFSGDGGVTWTPLRLVGVSKPGEFGFSYRAPAGLNFNPSLATPARDRYVVIPLYARGASSAARIVRAGYDGKIAEAYLPSAVVTTSELNDAIEAVDWKARVLVATTANITLSGHQTIDAIGVVTGDRVLVKNQSTSAENGIYRASFGAWTRADDAAVWADLVGAVVFVESGTVGTRTMWMCPTALAGGTLGSTNVTWVKVWPVTDDKLDLADTTNANVTSSAHGLAPKSPGDANQFLNGGATPAFAAVPGRFRAQYRYTSGSGTHTPQAGTTMMRVTLYGAGGGGGGVSAVAAQAAGAGGGGAGSKVVRWYTSPAAMAYAVGAGGAGGAAGNNNGAAGGATTFDTAPVVALVTAPGGSGGTGQASATGSAVAPGGAGGAVGTNGDINGTGAPGSWGGHFGVGQAMGGNGGSTDLGGGGLGPVSASGASAAGAPGGSPGAGGSGASTSNHTTDRAGGDGAAGLIIIDEFF